MGLFRRGSPRPPAEVRSLVGPDERVVSWAPVTGGGVAVATPLGLWLQGRRIAWQLIDHAVWRDGRLTVTEAAVVDEVLLVDQQPVSVPLDPPYDLPPTVQKRVTASVARSERQPLPGGSALFVARRVPGQDGLRWFARLEPGTPDTLAVRDLVRDRIAALMPQDGMD